MNLKKAKRTWADRIEAYQELSMIGLGITMINFGITYFILWICFNISEFFR